METAQNASNMSEIVEHTPDTGIETVGSGVCLHWNAYATRHERPRGKNDFRENSLKTQQNCM